MMTFGMSPEPWDEIVMCQKEKKITTSFWNVLEIHQG